MSDITTNKLANIVQEQIKTPHPPIGNFVLPAGVITDLGEILKDITVRELSGHEEDILAHPKMSPYKKINELLSGCLLKLGGVEDRKFIAESVKNMLSGDRTFLLIAIRRVTLGDAYTFADKCPECEAESLYTIDLSQLEPVNNEDTTKRFHEDILPSGKTVKWHYLNGRDEEKQQGQNKDDLTSMGILVRLDLLEGKAPKIGDVKALGQRDRQFLRNLFQEKEPGLDVNLEMQCSSCEHEFTRELELEPSFFYPSQTPKVSKKRSSS